MKKFLLKLSVLWETIHGFVFAVLASVFIIILTIGIGHNLLKINEMSSKYHGPYKNLVKIAETTMVNVYTVGDGGPKVLIMSGFGVQSPVLFYKSLADRLAQNGYKVIIVENLGYGFSTSAKTDRTNRQIVADMHEALAASGNVGPYILMPHSLGNIYALKYLQMYSDEVTKIISIDGVSPGMMSENTYSQEIRDMKTNVNITSILGLTGFERILSYVKPEFFYIDYMNDDPNYTINDIVLYRAEIAVNYLNRSMVKEIDQAEKNINEFRTFKYPEYLPVIQIITSETVDNYKAKVDEGLMNNDYSFYVEQMITNSEIQKVVQVDGEHMLPITAPYKIIEVINE